MGEPLVMGRLRRADGKLSFTRSCTVPELITELTKQLHVDKIYTLIESPDGKGYSLGEVGELVLDIRLPTPNSSRQVNPQPSAPLQPPTPDPLANEPEVVNLPPTGIVRLGDSPEDGSGGDKTERPIPTPRPVKKRAVQSQPEAPRKRKYDMSDLGIPDPAPRFKANLAGDVQVVAGSAEDRANAESPFFKMKRNEAA